MPTRAGATAMLVALVALAVPATLGAAKPPDLILFRATLTANMSVSLAYATRETTDACTYETTAGGSVAVALASARAAVVAARVTRGRLRFAGTLGALTATPSYGFANTHRKPVECSDPAHARLAVLAHCDPAVTLPIKNLRTAFALERGVLAFAPVGHPVLSGRVNTCQGPDPELGRGGLELATGRVSAAELRNPRTRRVVVDGAFTASVALAPPYSGTLERRVGWTLTLTRVTRR